MIRAIKFHKDHIPMIKSGEKRLTIRYDFNHKLRQGDKLRFMDTDYLLFGKARVMQFYTMTAKEIIETDWKYHYAYDNMRDFRRRFNAFYPDVDFEPQTKLTIIEWDRTFTPNWEYF